MSYGDFLFDVVGAVVVTTLWIYNHANSISIALDILKTFCHKAVSQIVQETSCNYQSPSRKARCTFLTPDNSLVRD